MNTGDTIRANLASVRAELEETFPHLSDDMLDWAPAPGMRTVQGQFVEILVTEHSIDDRLYKRPRRTYEEREAPFWEIKSVAGLVQTLAEVRRETLAFIEGMDEEALSAPVDVSPEFTQWQGIHPVSVAELVRFIARHEYYHVGQLTSYLWARGDDPYKWN